MHRPARASALLAAMAWLAGSAAWAQSSAPPPDSVKSALDLMSHVVADSGRLIASHRYDELPRESSELEKGLTTLERGLGSPPSALRSKLEPLIAKARVASSAMSEAVESHQESMLPLTQRQLAEAVKAIIDTFPAGLRPETGG